MVILSLINPIQNAENTTSRRRKAYLAVLSITDALL